MARKSRIARFLMTLAWHRKIENEDGHAVKLSSRLETVGFLEILQGVARIFVPLAVGLAVIIALLMQAQLNLLQIAR